MLKKVLPKNIANKISVPIIIILVLSIGFLIWYFSGQKEESHDLFIKAGKPGDLWLVKFPKDVINLIETEGVPAIVFSKDDKIGIESNLRISEQEILTFQIIDTKGQDVQKGTLQIVERSNKFIMCCFISPEKEGSYILELFSNGKKVPIFPLLFKVSP